MKQVINTEKKPIKLWLDNIEEGALEQGKNLANLPFTYKWVSIMPDSHQGYGMPIGAVLATEGVVIPNAVGVDIGCGMCAVKTSLTEIKKETLKEILKEIKKNIPVGFNKHKEEQDAELMPINLYNDLQGDGSEQLPIVSKEWNNALLSLGTLGGGNHFIEIQKGDDGYIWIMIHSGSRSLGKKVADHYNKVAIELNKTYHSLVDEKQELAFLPINSKEGKDYIREMNYCIEYALANRELMMERVLRIIAINAGAMKTEPIINMSHNHARIENHYGKNVMVHRKGATSAREGEIGMIPGSQGTKSYIVEGLGNHESFMSCSHGAGRVMGRKQAERELDLETEISKLDKLGVIHNIRTIKDLDEAPSAYKDIDVVMENQKDLVKIIVELIPLGVVKG